MEPSLGFPNGGSGREMQTDWPQLTPHVPTCPEGLGLFSWLRRREPSVPEELGFVVIDPSGSLSGLWA